MKKYIGVIFILLVSFLTYSQGGNPCDNPNPPSWCGGSDGPCTGPNPPPWCSAQVPIDTHIWFLIIGGIALGSITLAKKNANKNVQL